MGLHFALVLYTNYSDICLIEPVLVLDLNCAPNRTMITKGFWLVRPPLHFDLPLLLRRRSFHHINGCQIEHFAS